MKVYDKLLITLIFVVIILSCNREDQDLRNKKIIYFHDFSFGHGGWESPLNKVHFQELNKLDTVGPIFYRKGDTVSVNIKNKIINDYTIIQSPFFYDKNHSKPFGAGSLYLLTWIFMGGLNNTPSTNFIPFLDLRNKKLKVTLNIHDLKIHEGNLLFWFQTTMPDGKWANYALTSQPINKLITDTSNSFHEVILNFPEREDNGWTCLGASEREMHRFGCNQLFLNSISNVNYDFGFIIFPIDSNYANDYSRNLKIKNIEIFDF
jgi:hypothetical protein